MRKDDVSLDYCLKCSDCNTVCPVLTAFPLFPGPKHLGPELERLRREGLPCDSEWVEYCLTCDRCNLACPNQVEVAELIAAAKARHVKPPIRRLRDFWLSRPALLGRLITILPAVANLLLGLAPVRFLMSRTMKIARKRPFPAYARKTAAVRTAAAGHPNGPVLFFPGCAIDFNEQGLGRTVVEVLERAGFAPEVVDSGCCGIPALANGDEAEAKRRAAACVRAMEKAVANGTKIVTACTSCGTMLASGFPFVLGDDPDLADAAKRVAAASCDLGEFLLEAADGKGIPAHFGPVEMHLAYHAPCHQLAQGIGRPWVHLLERIPGIRVKDLNAGCCGMAGTFGFKEEKYPVSMAVGQRLFDAIREENPESVVTECPTCRMQIAHATSYRAIHPAEILLTSWKNASRAAAE